MTSGPSGTVRVRNTTPGGGVTFQPTWIPWMLILHVGTLPLAPILPEGLQAGTVLIMAVGFSGIAITANNAEVRVRVNT